MGLEVGRVAEDQGRLQGEATGRAHRLPGRGALLTADDASQTDRWAPVGAPPCAIAGCDAAATAPDLVALCADHLAFAAEVHGLAHGIGGALPNPCLLCGSRLGVRWPGGWTCAVCEWPHGEVPDTELPPPRVDVVYYLRLGDRVKIGTTANPHQRFRAVRHEEILALERGDRRLEHRRHVEFAEDRLGTSEWFAASERLLAHADVLAGGADPWDRWHRWIAEATAAS